MDPSILAVSGCVLNGLDPGLNINLKSCDVTRPDPLKRSRVTKI